MKNILMCMLFMFLFVSCNKDKGGESDEGTSQEPVVTEPTPIDPGTTAGSTSGGVTGTTTSGSTTSGLTSGTTSGSTGGTTGSTTGSTTSGSTGGTTGSTTGSTTSGSTGGTTGSTTGSTTGTTTGGSPGTGLPNAAYTFETFIKFINTTSTEQAKFDKAIEIIKKVVATEEFRSKILNHTYGGKKTFVDNGGFTNAQIYQKILDGAETLTPTKNNAMDMEVELYYAANTTVGYTYANTKRIWVNTKYFKTNAVTSVAANLVHEWLHKVGFKHAVSYSTSRDYSVPYAIGRIMGTLGKEFD